MIPWSKSKPQPSSKFNANSIWSIVFLSYGLTLIINTKKVSLSVIRILLARSKFSDSLMLKVKSQQLNVVCKSFLSLLLNINTASFLGNVHFEVYPLTLYRSPYRSVTKPCSWHSSCLWTSSFYFLGHFLRTLNILSYMNSYALRVI